MGFVKLVKNKAYYKRFKVKLRRRRECKTDYQARRRMIAQDRRKYGQPIWRLVVRRSNKQITCQIVKAQIIGDHIICCASSNELPRYGLSVGLTNYAAAYCTGLLVARRLLKKLKLDGAYKGKETADGEDYKVEYDAESKVAKPFRCILDVGLARTTLGARVFGALKGAVDGGLDVPHSHKKMPGFKKGEGDEEDTYDAATHAHKIFGGHVADYMRLLKEENPEKYKRQFSRFIKENINPDDLKGKYEEVHRQIRENPSAVPKKKRDWRTMQKPKPKQIKLTLEERKQRRREKIEQMAASAQKMDVDADGAK